MIFSAMRNKRFKAGTFFFHISQLYIYLFAIELWIASTLFFIGRPIGWYLLPISFSLAIVMLSVFYDHEIDKWFAGEIFVSIILLVMFVYVSGRVFDTSWDGNTYHKFAVGMLKNRWNPFYEPSAALAGKVIGSDNLYSADFWADVYPKGTEIFGASVYLLTDNIEGGKAFILIGMFCTFSICYYFLRQHNKSTVFALIFSAIAALNPISIAQADSFYVDGFMHNLLLIEVLFLIVSIEGRNVISDKLCRSLIAGTVIICINIKFTGLVFSGIYCIAYYLYFCVLEFRKKDERWLQKCIRRGIGFAVVAAVAILWIGNTSYLMSISKHHTLCYPLTGKNPMDIISGISPFGEKNHLKNLLVSIYSELSSYAYSAGIPPKLKIPLSIHNPEEKVHLLRYVDLVVSGFGVWFSAVFTISLIVILLKLIKMKRGREFWFWIMNLGIIALLCLLLSESWNARYSPHIYFISMIGLYFMLDSKMNLLQKVCGGIFSIIFIVNNLLFLWFLPDEVEKSNELRDNLVSMRQYDCVLFDYTGYGAFPSFCFNLLDYDIHYQVDFSLGGNPDSILLHEEYPYFSSARWMPRQ